LALCCSAENDLYRVLQQNGLDVPRFHSPTQAINDAPVGAGVLILADGYPTQTTDLEPSVFEQAAEKQMRLYVEYPAWLPNLLLGEPSYLKTGTYNAVLERTVVASQAFEPDLPKMRILMIHDCHYMPVEAQNPHLVLAHVVGYDTAVLGLPQKTSPILFQLPRRDVMVATTKLSQFVTARYAPADAWRSVWRMILGWLQPGREAPNLQWIPTVRTSFQRMGQLPENAQIQAVRRASQWYQNSRLLVHPSWEPWTANETTGVMPLPADWPGGDGSLGIEECYISKRIFTDGRQPVNWVVRADCCGEYSMGAALGAVVVEDPYLNQVAANLNDFIYFQASFSQGQRADPQSPSYGLLGGNIISPHIYYSDDNARALLGTITSAAALNSDRWDESILRSILGNFRTTGVFGFRPAMRLEEHELQQREWRYYWQWDGADFSSHYHAYIWTVYLWLYDKTGWKPLLERTRSGVRLMMAAYPDHWKAECGRMEEERIHMLLPLAWLVRVADTPEHRAWLRQMAEYVLAEQDESGAIPQRVDQPFTANEQYGMSEAPIVYDTGDPATDLLYSTNFAAIGLHEAAAATGDLDYAEAADRLADFLIRIQIRSEAHPELDGSWYRGFDFRRWDYWGSDGDAGWGVWSTETGWTHSWITATLALRQMETSLWDLSAGSQIARHFQRYQEQMLPDKA
jgi:hypothetical protein